MRFGPVAAVVLLVATMAGCMQPEGGGSTAGTTSGVSATTSGSTSGIGVITRLQFREHAELGPILADGDGRTLYIFTNDEVGLSNCSGACLANWPPARADGIPPAPSSIQGNISLITTASGTQLAYEGWPLYYWVGDKAAGEATGDTVGGNWFVVRQPVAPEAVWAEGTMQTTGEDVQYTSGVTGYYARPAQATTGAATGVVMIHEWWGLNANMRAMADTLASHGYHVLAVDLFHGQVATTSQEALAQVQALDQQEATANMQGAADFLRSKGAVGIQSLGWCFGGGQSLQLALSGEELLATVIYYGTPVTDEARLAAIDWPVLGIFAEDDQAIPVAQARAFDKALGNASVERTVLVYPDVGHAFANPTGNAWAPLQTHDAWLRTIRFLDEHRA